VNDGIYLPPMPITLNILQIEQAQRLQKLNGRYYKTSGQRGTFSPCVHRNKWSTGSHRILGGGGGTVRVAVYDDVHVT
jgi:hypothetical protein